MVGRLARIGRLVSFPLEKGGKGKRKKKKIYERKKHYKQSDLIHQLAFLGPRSSSVSMSTVPF